MTDPEITVEVTIPDAGETPPDATPIVVVSEPAAAPANTDPGVIMTLEMLRDQIAGIGESVLSLTGTLESINGRLDYQMERINAVEVVEESESDDVTEIVAETIPAAVVEVVADVQPAARKRRFI